MDLPAWETSGLICREHRGASYEATSAFHGAQPAEDWTTASGACRKILKEFGWVAAITFKSARFLFDSTLASSRAT